MSQVPLTLPIGNVAGMTATDVATNMMLGDEQRPPLPPVEPGVEPRAHLDALLGKALAAGRCFVPFSGGRDSSCMLALATDAARRRGLPDPIPVTTSFRDAPGADERGYQELVVRRLRLADWEIVEVGDELQLVGPVAQRALLRHGLLFPAAAHTMIPVLERAAGGTVILPIGQSDFFHYWRFARLSAVIKGQRRPRRGDLAEAAFALLPAPVRRAVFERKIAAWSAPWMEPELQRWFARERAARQASAPIRFDRAIDRAHAQRCYLGAVASLEALAATAGVRMVIPWYDPATVALVRHVGGRLGRGDRATALGRLAGDLLPEAVLTRRDSSHLGEVLYGDETRAFAARWSGGGLEELPVDPSALREMWLGDAARQDVRAALLMQLAWLHDELAARPAERDDRAALIN